MSYRVKKLDSRVMYQNAYCGTCDKEWTTNNAMAVAKRHAAAHGHTVNWEQNMVGCYKGVKDD